LIYFAGKIRQKSVKSSRSSKQCFRLRRREETFVFVDPSGIMQASEEILPPGCPQPTPDREFSQRIEGELPFLRRIVRRWHRERADADDLVQDTLVRALANAHLWQSGTSLRAWLFAIMRNQFLAGIGKSNRLAAALQSFAEADRSRAPDPHEARLILQDVAGALKRLPSKQRTALLLAGVEGKSYDEVAQAMGLSVGAVRCHLARGRDRLRTATDGATDTSPFSRRAGRLPSPAAEPPAAAAMPRSAAAQADAE
jgi:RNA polymerase sigma-70 factor (ECF subfamily)